MDAEGIDVQVLFGGLVLGVTGYDDAGFALDVCRAYDDWLLRKVCGHAPARLKGVAVVPLQDVARAIEEAERAASLGAVAVTIPPVLGARNLDDATLLPFFEACAVTRPRRGGALRAGHEPAAARRRALRQLRPGARAVVPRRPDGGAHRAHPRRRARPVPALRVAFLESGVGWVPYFVHRLHEHHEKLPHLLDDAVTDPRAILERGQCYFSFEAEESLLATYVEHLGDRSLVYASDYPHWDSDFPGTVDEVRRQAGEQSLGDTTLRRILAENAATLYGLS